MADGASRDDDTIGSRHSPLSSRRSSQDDLSSIPGESTSRRIYTPDTVRRRARPPPFMRVDGHSFRSPNLSEIRQTGKRPSILRRQTSRQTPYRGQEFSVDDDSLEINPGDDQIHLDRNAASRPPPSLRRRPTLPAPRTPIAQADDVKIPGDDPTLGGAASDITPKMPAIDENAGNDENANNDGHADNDENADNDEIDEVDDENEDELSDAESFTLKDRQEAINETHPFGIRIWKPALYKKGRSVEKDAEGDIHSTPGGSVSRWLWLFNFAWTLLCGWWLALLAAIGGSLCLLFSFAPGCEEYGRVLLGLASYIFYPFGKYVKLVQDDAYAEEDQGEGRSITEYEQWQGGDIEEGHLFFGPVGSLVGRHRQDDDLEDETASLLGRQGHANGPKGSGPKAKRRLFGRGQWTPGRVIYFVIFYGLLTPSLFLVSGISWLLVFSIPMGRLTLLLHDHLRRHPLALEFHSDRTYTRGPGSTPSSILVCTYRAVGPTYWKYTIDGTNIILINLLGVVAFVIFDYWLLRVAFGIENALTNTFFLFLLSLFSVIPLAYFVGQAVASISAQSSMGVGAAVNAFFSTIVEVFLYCIALRKGKGQLVEGSVIGSIFAGILLLPGISMCFGAIKRKTQRFNVRSAGVTSTMLLFATIGVFGPTIFYQIYGAHRLACYDCRGSGTYCRQCFSVQIPDVHDRFFTDMVRPYTWFAAVALFCSYVIGLLFTLRTHAATIWNTEVEEKKVEKEAGPTTASATLQQRATSAPMRTFAGPRASLSRLNTAGSTTGTPALPRPDIRESQLYRRILGQSLKQVGMSDVAGTREAAEQQHNDTAAKPSEEQQHANIVVHGMSEQDSDALVRQIAEISATAAAVAARDATAAPRGASVRDRAPAGGSTCDRLERVSSSHTAPNVDRPESIIGERAPTGIAAEAPAGGGHDAPNWSRTKSYVVLLSATVAYAVIAEILVDTVDSVLSDRDIDEKFLGITLFALVPNTTEFLNAISFAMNGNIALSMEIGSAYALQVCLLQIPALVLFSAIYGRFIDPSHILKHTFPLIFPSWDLVTVFLSIFLLNNVTREEKSNYWKGSILVLGYLVVVVGFHFASFSWLNRETRHPT